MAWIKQGLFNKILEVIPVVGVDVLVLKNNEVLLVKRAIEPYNGYWTLPGGLVVKGELIKDAAVREVREEAGVDVRIRDFFALNEDVNDPRGHIISLTYTADFLRGNLKPTDHESSGVKFFNIHNLPDNIGFFHRSLILGILKNV